MPARGAATVVRLVFPRIVASVPSRRQEHHLFSYVVTVILL